MSILLSPSFLIFVLLIVLNFVLIFSGQTPLQLLAGIFTFSLFVAAVLTLIGVAWGRIIGFIVLILALVMALLLAQQAGFLV
ncbi:MAG: hypothetical protein HOJ21_14045 [Alphaproteobacteria bacterium]|nr:hypothetical protein [Alphaproteobacteria bacterium]